MLINQMRRLGALFVCTVAIFSGFVSAQSDPMRPPGKSQMSVLEKSPSGSAIKVTAVLKKNQMLYAVINNKWLKNGDKVGAWRVIDITGEGVFLKNENEPGARPLKFLVNEKSDFKKQTNNE